MSDKSKIEWTETTWNPVTGCSKVSQGCKNCYALRDWPRLSANPRSVYYGRQFTDVQCHAERLDQPLRWTKPRKVFVNSMSDLFHEDVPFEFIDKVFAVMVLADQHIFQILTKRPERMRDYFLNHFTRHQTARMGVHIWGGKNPDYIHDQLCLMDFPIPNVWLGVSVEDQTTADDRIALLLDTPAAVRWLSMEPLLGPVDLECTAWPTGWERPVDDVSDGIDPLRFRGPRIDWVVVGGESGPQARPMHPDWVRSLRDQCSAARVPFFFKQWGEWAPDCLCGTPSPCRDTPRPTSGKIGVMFRCGKKRAGRTLDGRTWDEYPQPEPEYLDIPRFLRRGSD